MNAKLALALAALALSACKEDTSASTRDARATMQLTEQASTVIGVPAIKNFAEKRQLKAIYELRDTANLVTYTYTIDMAGKRHKVCPSTSVGFGIPYSTQYTAPKALRAGKPMWPDGTQYSASGHTYEADQPEPNGLYMPQQADGTWVLCLHPNGKDLAPTYIEPHVVVYLFEMPAVD
jgi:hypothetical protein